MTFAEDNAAYEAWLRTQCAVVQGDLDRKHKRMRKNAFVFLRATFFRWAKTIPALCPHLVDAPAIAAVGDVHTENFGTWRDDDGRLVWGINDFDEAAIAPYAFDLVRLAASAALAPGAIVPAAAAADAILNGYRRALDSPGPTLLDEQSLWLRRFVQPSDDDRTAFWSEVAGYPGAVPPDDAKLALQGVLPAGATVDRYASRRKGGGSLGRPRYLAIATWRGGTIVREAKAWVPSAWAWANNDDCQPGTVMALAVGAFRSPDPWFRIDHGYIVRRIAADSRKVDLGDDPGGILTAKLLAQMGADLAAIHAAGGIESIRRDFDARPRNWLAQSAATAAAQVEADFQSWGKG